MKIKIKKPNDIYDLLVLAILIPIFVVGAMCISVGLMLLCAIFIPIATIASIFSELWDILKQFGRKILLKMRKL